MDAIWYVLPLTFVVVGWATEHLELYAMAGALGFYTAYSLIIEGTLDNQVMFLAIVYVMFSIGALLRIVTDSADEKENKMGGRRNVRY